MVTRRKRAVRKTRSRSGPATRRRTVPRAATRGETSTKVLAWEDDPDSGAPALQVAVPNLTKKPFALKIVGLAPPAKVYDAGTAKFRYWTAADALARAATFWAGIVPSGTSWQPGATLAVKLDNGSDLNAYYDRNSLSFFHAPIGTKTVYSGESPDILCHELGHAVLDAVRPQLWDATADEVAAFHESFGDMSAILSALQVQPFRIALLSETGGRLYRSSRLSRLAEQLGWAIRSRRPDLVDPDCLRNAVNSFFYRTSDTIPPDGPATILSSEPHSYSRVFTGGFFSALAGMLNTRSSKPKEADLAAVSRDAGHLLIDRRPGRTRRSGLLQSGSRLDDSGGCFPVRGHLRRYLEERIRPKGTAVARTGSFDLEPSVVEIAAWRTSEGIRARHRTSAAGVAANRARRRTVRPRKPATLRRRARAAATVPVMRSGARHRTGRFSVEREGVPVVRRGFVPARPGRREVESQIQSGNRQSHDSKDARARRGRQGGDPSAEMLRLRV